MIKISVIMPVYNKQKYLEKSIRSILNQRFDEFELIIIDDGSTDESGTIADFWKEKDRRVKVYHIKNSGVSNARNFGLDKATGVYITFIDADDYIKDDYLIHLYKCIEEHKVDIVVSNLKKVWENFDKVEDGKMPAKGTYEMKKIMESFAEWQEKTSVFGYCCAKIFRKELIDEIKFDTKLKLAEDFDFYLNVYKRVKTIYFDDYKGYYYLQEAENCSVKPDYEIDYFSQLIINLRYKEFLQFYDSFHGNNERIVNQLINNYFYFSLFYCNLSVFDEMFSKLYDLYCKYKPELIQSQLLAKWYLFLLCHNQRVVLKTTIQFYRFLRKMIRGN